MLATAELTFLNFAMMLLHAVCVVYVCAMPWQLCGNMLDSNEQKREISGCAGQSYFAIKRLLTTCSLHAHRRLGMKTLLSGMIDSAVAARVIQKILPAILAGIEGVRPSWRADAMRDRS